MEHLVARLYYLVCVKDKVEFVGNEVVKFDCSTQHGRYNTIQFIVSSSLPLFNSERIVLS